MDLISGIVDILFGGPSPYQLKEDIQKNEDKTVSHENEIQRLQIEVVNLRLALTSIAELLEESRLLDRTKLLNKIQEVDQRGKLRVENTQPDTIECPSCHHQHLVSLAHCIYCGEAMGNQTPNESN